MTQQWAKVGVLASSRDARSPYSKQWSSRANAFSAGGSSSRYTVSVRDRGFAALSVDLNVMTIFTDRNTGGKAVSQHFPGGLKRVPLDTIFPLRAATFYGMPCMIPCSPETALEIYYGAWKTPPVALPGLIHGRGRRPVRHPLREVAARKRVEN